MVRVADPPAEVTLTGLVPPKLRVGGSCAPCGLEVTTAVSETLPTKPPEPLIDIVSVMLPPGATEMPGAVGESVNPGAMPTVSETAVVAVRLPEVPFTVMVLAPRAAVLLAVIVTTEDPLVGLVAKVAVTPAGSPVAASVTLPVKLLTGVTVIVSVAAPPCVTVREADAGAMVKLGGATTVSATVVDAVRLPEVPVIVMVLVPAVAVLLAVNVATLDPLVGLVAKAAVTPAGRPVAARVTLPVKLLAGVTVIVSVAVLPWVTDNVEDVAARVKLGAVVTAKLRETWGAAE